ncbi:hypothetical protein IE53DRAFT_372296 [Violaceomyces palustris]|uniref:Uncharacterized protein n=1 Tax=Violaceomyces palustris TaxID=1673888 RepID=A0ACD0NL79_9BASI|nr:hypothetical protein IE53DRAFT_372296 [Violaceomyces palustris]
MPSLPPTNSWFQSDLPLNQTTLGGFPLWMELLAQDASPSVWPDQIQQGSREGQPQQQPISVPVAIILGLVASFIQSLGITIQRKSHLENEALPLAKRRTEWKRPLWILGFTIFLCANIGGTVFQIGALPIVMLAPLGAVSLLYNALLARWLLDDFLSKFMIVVKLGIVVASGN